MPMPEPLSDAELGAIASRVDAATPGPWFVRLLGDDWAMNLVAVATSPDTDRSEHWPGFPFQRDGRGHARPASALHRHRRRTLGSERRFHRQRRN